MRKIFFLIFILIGNCLIMSAQDRERYHIYNEKYEHHLEVGSTTFKKLEKLPQKYHNKHIELKGYLIINQDNKSFIFKNKQDFKNFNKGLAVSKYQIIMSDQEAEFIKESCSHRKVVIYGTFDQKMNSFSNVVIIPVSLEAS